MRDEFKIQSYLDAESLFNMAIACLAGNAPVGDTKTDVAVFIDTRPGAGRTNCPGHKSIGSILEASPLASLSRTAIENCGVSTVSIDEINRAVGLASKCEISDERSIRKLTQRVGLEAITLWLRV